MKKQSWVRGEEVQLPPFNRWLSLSSLSPLWIYIFSSPSLSISGLKLFLHFLSHTHFSSRVGTCACTCFERRGDRRNISSTFSFTRCLALFVTVYLDWRGGLWMNQVHQWITTEDRENEKYAELMINPFTLFKLFLSAERYTSNVKRGEQERRKHLLHRWIVLLHQVSSALHNAPTMERRSASIFLHCLVHANNWPHISG